MARNLATDRVVASLRYLPVVVVPGLLLASTFPGRYSVPLGYWLLSMSAVAAFVAGKWWPTASSIVLSALAVPMFGTEAWGLSQLVPYLGAVGLVDVVVRERRVIATSTATAAWAAAVAADGWMADHANLWSASSIVKVIASVAIPVLLGLYLRSQRELASSYRQRALDADARRRQAEQQARTDERVALARELHDLVAHHMASIVLRVGVAQHVLKPDDEPVRLVLDEVKDTASHALADIRRLLVALRDPSLGDVALVDPDQLIAELTAAIDRVRGAGFDVDATAITDSDLGGLDAIGRLTTLRVIQEALTNAMKYADANGPVAVSISRGETQVRIVIVNDVGATGATVGHGIVGMTERVHLLGGSLDAGPDGSGRWRVAARIPLTGKEIVS